MCRIVSIVLFGVALLIGVVSAALWWSGKDAIGITMDIVAACVTAVAAIMFILSFFCCAGGDEDEEEDTTTHSSV